MGAMKPKAEPIRKEDLMALPPFLRGMVASYSDYGYRYQKGFDAGQQSAQKDSAGGYWPSLTLPSFAMLKSWNVLVDDEAYQSGFVVGYLEFGDRAELDSLDREALATHRELARLEGCWSRPKREVRLPEQLTLGV